jgi:hypothetical protein
MNQAHFLQVDEGESQMLQTIRIPKNLHFLTEKLPKANYSPVKVVHLDRKGFFRTIGGNYEEPQDYAQKLPAIAKNNKSQHHSDKNLLDESEIYEKNNRSKNAIGELKKNLDSSIVASRSKINESRQHVHG